MHVRRWFSLQLIFKSMFQPFESKSDYKHMLGLVHRGPQGHQNLCTLDAYLFAVFWLCTVEQMERKDNEDHNAAKA